MVYSRYLILCSGSIELCSIVVIYLGDFDIGLSHPIIVQCIHVHVCMMKVFRRKKKKEKEFEKVERREVESRR